MNEESNIPITGRELIQILTKLELIVERLSKLVEKHDEYLFGEEGVDTRLTLLEHEQNKFSSQITSVDKRIDRLTSEITGVKNALKYVAALLALLVLAISGVISPEIINWVFK